MPLKLHQVRKRKAPFTAEFSIDGGLKETLTGNFNPAIYTPKYVNEVKGMDNEDPLTFARLLSPLLVDWDLVYTKEDEEEGLCKPEEVGTMCPTTVDFLSGMPIEFLSGVFTGIRGEAQPVPNSLQTSGDSSFQAEDAGPVLVNTD